MGQGEASYPLSDLFVKQAFGTVESSSSSAENRTLKNSK